MIAVLSGLLWLDWRLERAASIPFATIMAVMVAALMIPAVLELSRLARAGGVSILLISGIAGSICLATSPVWWLIEPIFTAQIIFAIVGAILICVFIEQMIFRGTDSALPAVAATCLAIMYLGIGGALILTIRVAYGMGALILFIAAVKMTDTGAYFIGKAIGRHKLVPSISPGKTWEGLIGGIVAAIGVSLLGDKLLCLGLGVGQAVIFGVVIAIAGQFVDLCESVLKRSAGMKDSGASVPQFGGVLDILDSPLLASPVAWLMFYIMM